MSGNDALLATSDVTPIEEEVDAPFDANTLDAVDLLRPPLVLDRGVPTRQLAAEGAKDARRAETGGRESV